ncbi:hypothetical protein [Paenibacillus crassostreae]|uniref:Phage tail tape measure protein n=1 Tax=Paenibacillus crassostreae TaxID=1763538 RepID=A0A167C5E9_9BACL|nr:hypothetical protein [Paenibacillus crassostreae]AOZ91626.1 hypothetical protein LPB68_04940 [Paenibacillus crassostreae]OAB72800.1 hypothetical protein PNBC_15310 [Paenibacillus crassostreae]
MASKRDLQALIVLAGKIDPSLAKAIKDTDKKVNGLGNSTAKFGNIASKAFGIATKAATIGAAAIGVGLVAVAKQGLDLASDLTEVQNVVDVTFGKGAEQINAFANTALKSFGLSELSAKQYTGTLGALMKSSGISSDHLIQMSENLTGLSGDFASFYNLDPAEAFEKIKSGISGETEPLRALGINMSVANLEAYALAQGIKTSWDKMSQGDQVMLRYNYLLQQSADAQGDFARTQDGYANQQRLFGEGFKQLSANIMKAALPAFTKLYEKGNQLIDSFASSPEKMGKLQDIIAKVSDTIINSIPGIVSGVGKFIAILGQVYNKATDVGQFISSNWSLIKPIILGIVGAMALWKIGSGIAAGIKSITKAYEFLGIAKSKDKAITLYLNALYLKDAVVKGTSTVATWAMVAAGSAWNVAAGIGATVTTALASAVAFLTSPIGLVILAVAALVAGIILLWQNWDQVSTWMVDVWQNKVLPVFQMVGSFFSTLWDGATAAFKGFINMAIGGINKLIAGLNKIQFQLPEWAGGQEFGINIPMIPAFAKGGFTNQPSIFGEAGPEAAIPLKRTPRSLSLLNQTAKAIGADTGGGERPTFVFAPVYSGSGSGDVSKDLEEAGDDFFDRADAWWESKRRVSFG